MLSRDSIVAEEARRWIDSAGDRWRLQVLSRRVRVLPDGTRKEIPSRIRRFVEGLPWPYVKPAMDYLISLAPYDGKIANGVDFETEYRPTITLWQRDAQSVAAGPRQNPADATYTLIQDLVENTDRDVYAVGSSSSCSEEAVTDYVWDAPDVEEVPAGGQGVTYAVAAVHRNEDGTFDYQLVKRTARTQHVEETVVRSDNRVHATVELFDNVYTDPVKGYVDETGAPLGVPEPSVVDDGTTTTVTRIDDLLENADCTLKFRVVRETRSRNAERDACEKTIFEHEHTTATPGNASPLGEAPAASGGVVTSHDSRLQEDGTYVNAVGTKTELPVKDAEYSVQVGRKGRRITRSDRNQPSPASTSDVGTGGRVDVKKTPGGRYDNTVSTFDRSQKVVAGDHCKVDLFSHVDGETVAGESMPSANDHVTGGVGGRVVTRDVDMDEDGAITRRTVVEQEKSVPAAVESWTVTTHGVRHTVTGRNQASKGAAPSFSLGNVGRQVENRRTPGGLYDVTTTTVAASGTLQTGFGCERTVFSEVDRAEESRPPGALPKAHQTAGGGVTRTVTSRVADDGTVQVSTQTTTEKLADGGEGAERRLHGYVTTVTTRNTPAKSGTFAGIGDRFESSRNPGGTYNLVQTLFHPVAAGQVGSQDVESPLQTSTGSTTHGLTPLDAGGGGGGGQTSTTWRRLDDGTYETTVVTTSLNDGAEVSRKEINTLAGGTSEITQNGSAQWRTSSISKVGEQTELVTLDYGTRSTHLDPRAYRNGLKISKRVQKTAFEETAVTLTGTDLRSAGDGLQAGGVGSQVLFTGGRSGSTGNVATGHKIVVKEHELTGLGFRNETETERTAFGASDSIEWTSVVRGISSRQEYACGIYVYRNQVRMPQVPSRFDKDSEISCSLQLNEFGLYDVTFTCRKLGDAYTTSGKPGSGGQGDQHKNMTFIERKIIGYVEYTRRWTAHVRYLWSTMDNMRDEIIQSRAAAGGYDGASIGWVSHMDGQLHCAVIYTNVVPEEWQVGNHQLRDLVRANQN